MYKFFRLRKYTFFKIILVFLAVVGITILWLSQVVTQLKEIDHISVIEQNYNQSNFSVFDEQLLAGEFVKATFTAEVNNLGIVAVRFNTYNKINSDKVTFSIKEQGAEEWLFQHQYLVDQFQPDQFFTFGFPIITDSENKIYEFLIRSESGSAGDAVGISKIEPVFVTRHSYPSSLLQAEKKLIPYFIAKKIENCNCDQIIRKTIFDISGLITISSTVIWFLVDLFREILTRKNFKKIKKSFKKNKIIFQTRKLTQRLVGLYHHDLDNFFLLDKNRAFPAFDGLRAWAIVMVFMAHMAAPLGRILVYGSASNFERNIYLFFQDFPFVGIRGGTAGVDLFFMLSGFLMFMSLRKNKYKSISSFIKKRYQRLLPAHIFILLPLVFGMSILTIILNIFFIVDFFTRLPNANVLTWTMSYEMVFYLICAIWFIWGKKYPITKSWRFLLGLAAGLYLTRIFTGFLLTTFSIRYLDMSRFMAFFFGVALAKIFFTEKKLWKKIEKHAIKLGFLGVSLIVIFRYSWHVVVFDRIFNQMGIDILYLILDVGLFLLLIATIAKKQNIFNSFFSHKILRVLGVVSYSFYLNHLFWGLPLGQGILETLAFESRGLNMVLYVALTFICSFMIAIFSFHYLEKPYFKSSFNPSSNQLKKLKRTS